MNSHSRLRTWVGALSYEEKNLEGVVKLHYLLIVTNFKLTSLPGLKLRNRVSAVYEMNGATSIPGFLASLYRCVFFMTLVLYAVQNVDAFGAGSIPTQAAIEGINFRHGDVENTLSTLVMSTRTWSKSYFKLTRAKKFSNMAIKQVYFGNWLRDYSQSIDLAILTKGISPELIRVILWIMACTEFGYNTAEFEVTKERLGVYRAEEHIDNPKGYGEGLDARKYDERLRGPVDPQELEIDPKTGMKNYIANENGGWPTSTSFVRTSLQKCIEFGRKSRTPEGTNAAQIEAYRLLGQGLHTLEDFSAHSNYLELVLIRMGYTDVFPFVGSNTTIDLNGQRVFPIVTGTFGGQDFIHSMVGGAQDSLSQMEIAKVQAALADGAADYGSADRLKKLFSLFPNFYSPDEKGNQADSNPGPLQSFVGAIDRLRDSCYESRDPVDIAAQVYPHMEFRDRVMRKVEKLVPGLSDLKDTISETLTIFVMGNIHPLVSPILQEIIDALYSSTEVIINDQDQYLVWTDPNCADPTHSQLSKDHFSAYLNEPAGKIATAIVAYTVPLIVQAWEDPTMDTDTIIRGILQVFHHPALASTEIQLKMRTPIEQWVAGLGQDADAILAGFTAEGVRRGKHLKPKNGMQQKGLAKKRVSVPMS